MRGTPSNPDRRSASMRDVRSDEPAADTAAIGTRGYLTESQLADLRLAVNYAMALERGEVACAPDLSAVNAGQFVAAVRRHRLEGCLAPHLSSTGIAPEAVATVGEAARQSSLRALAVGMETRRLTELLAAAGIRVLTFKGIALAIQTTGDFFARGGGDVDLLVHPDDVIGAVAVLEDNGFQRTPGHSIRRLDSRLGSYVMWADYELALDHAGIHVDLHWWLTNVRSALPAFDELWDRRVNVDLAGSALPTLGLADAFEHSCAHTLKEEWASLRSLVDIDRLARNIPAADAPRLHNSRAVRLTTQVALASTGSDHLAAWATVDEPTIARIEAVATRRQRLPTSYKAPRISPTQAWGVIGPQRELAADTSDWVRAFVTHLLPVSYLNDPRTGEDLRFASALATRIKFGISRFTNPRTNPSPE